MVIFFMGFLFIAAFVIINLVFAYQAKHIDPSLGSTLWFQFKMLPFFYLVNVLIGLGYVMGMKSIGNVPVIGVISKVVDVLTILIAAYFIFAAVPSWKAVVGIIIMLIGVAIVILFK